VRVAALRTALLSTIPILSDAVIAGENRPCVTALAWLNHTAPVATATAKPTRAAEGCLTHPDLDAGEITDKGYVNQRRVLQHRSAFVERLYRTEPDPAVITAQSAGCPNWDPCQSVQSR
jgi:feruloyl-CoA synthase